MHMYFGNGITTPSIKVGALDVIPVPPIKVVGNWGLRVFYFPGTPCFVPTLKHFSTFRSQFVTI